MKSKLQVSQSDTASHGRLLSSAYSSNEATLPGSASLANKVRRIATISTFILRGWKIETTWESNRDFSFALGTEWNMIGTDWFGARKRKLTLRHLNLWEY